MLSRVPTNVTRSVNAGPGSFQVPAAERRRYADIKLSSNWHPDILRSIRKDESAPDQTTETTDSQLPSLSSYVGPPMPGVGLPVLDCDMWNVNVIQFQTIGLAYIIQEFNVVSLIIAHVTRNKKKCEKKKIKQTSAFAILVTVSTIGRNRNCL